MLAAWYLRSALSWRALLGCCAAALLLSLALERWPSTAMVLLPAVVATCAAAAAFSFDEVALAVVTVTPRGGTWRRAARLSSVVVPLVAWTALVDLRPGDVPLARGAWWLVGFAAIVLTAGLAALASRRGVALPGSLLAPAVAIAAISPVVLGAFFGWNLYPVADFERVLTFWLGVAAAGVLACAAALRPGVG